MVHGREVVGLWGRWRELRRLKHQVKVARLQADVALAAYYTKSRIEWDLKGTNDSTDHTLKDEWLIALWSAMTIGLFIPGVRDYILPGFESLKSISENAPSIFLYGWYTIFAATFAVRGWARYNYPNRMANFMSSMQGIPDDVPYDAAARAQSSIDRVASQATLSASEMTGGGFRVN